MKVTYVSGPITTGRRFVDWYKSTGKTFEVESEQYHASLQRFVIQPNERELRKFTLQLRRHQGRPVIDPAGLKVSGWSQSDYYRLWDRVIARYADRIILMPGWEYSIGCAKEFRRAIERGIRIESYEGAIISEARGLELLHEAYEAIKRDDVPLLGIGSVLRKLKASQQIAPTRTSAQYFRKDESLDRLADKINVAQFVSFSPESEPKQEYSRVFGCDPNEKFSDPHEAISTLLERSSEKSVNVRSYKPDSPQSHEFIYGIKSVDRAEAEVRRLIASGLHVISNETIDVRDGGVSGVVQGDIIEFSPDDTPRCVEKPGVASIRRDWGMSILTAAYGFTPDLNVPGVARLEFSIHPIRRGWRNTQTIGWELEDVGHTELSPRLRWPNNFSRMIGDKAFGLLIANCIGLPVPRTTVINRRIAPFSFGRRTGIAEHWLRTAPTEQVAGYFTTQFGWSDPFALMQLDDPSGNAVASLLSQEAVESVYSGAAVVDRNGNLVVEGRAGQGEVLMRGQVGGEVLPVKIVADIKRLYGRAKKLLGPVRFEWVHDGRSAWIVQLHIGATESLGAEIVPGEAAVWREFDATAGLEELRQTLKSLEKGSGLLIRGSIGLTSHLADVLRKSGVPARIGSLPISNSV